MNTGSDAEEQSGRNMRLLWLGHLFDEATALSCPAISLAANRWQSGLISGLRDAGCELRMLGHMPEQLWPRGKNWYVCGQKGEAPVPGAGGPILRELVPYLNLPGLRSHVLARQYARALARSLREGPHPDAVLTYNVLPHSLAVARIARRFAIPWIPVIADAPGDPAAYRRLEQQFMQAAGCVFLSWDSFERWNGTPKLHLDGGVIAAPERELDVPLHDGPRIIFFSGNLGPYAGVNLLLDAFAQMHDPDLRLWICGKGSNAKLAQALRKDMRITFFGGVSEQKLTELSRQAWVMVNPRPGHVPGNEHNFPSKVLEYLAYGKPVVSTMTLGLAPCYRDIIVPVDTDTPQALARKIQKVLDLLPDERAVLSRRICQFLIMNKTWQMQGSRLTKWLRTEVVGLHETGASRSAANHPAIPCSGDWLRRTIRRLLPTSGYNRLAQHMQVLSVVRREGFGSLRILGKLDKAEIEVRFRNLEHPFRFQRTEGHVGTIIQNVLREEYGRFSPSPPPRVIIDAGAFIGDVSCWFGSRYPHATIVGLEPNGENFRFASMNAAAYGRIQMIQKGLWNRTTRLIVSGSGTGSQVTETDCGETGTVDAIDVPSLMAWAGISEIDIMKMDIEGAEAVVFSSPGDWINHVGMFIIEPHSPAIEQLLQTCLGRYGFQGRRYRSLLYFRR